MAAAVILFPILALVIALALAAQIWLVVSGTAWTLVRHHRRARYHPGLRAIAALTVVQLVAVALLGLVVVAER